MSTKRYNLYVHRLLSQIIWIIKGMDVPTLFLSITIYFCQIVFALAVPSFLTPLLKHIKKSPIELSQPTDQGIHVRGKRYTMAEKRTRIAVSGFP